MLVNRSNYNKSYPVLEILEKFFMRIPSFCTKTLNIDLPRTKKLNTKSEICNLHLIN